MITFVRANKKSNMRERERRFFIEKYLFFLIKILQRLHFYPYFETLNYIKTER